jgi:hypothetical protein
MLAFPLRHDQTPDGRGVRAIGGIQFKFHFISPASERQSDG